jgi:TRAP-type C4-dicarboxylate transport system permease small subunit
MSKKFIASILALSLVLPVITLATEDSFPFAAASPRFSLPTVSLESTVKRVTDLLFYFIVLISIVMVLWGGVTLATAAGDPSKVDLARHLIMYALIAIVVGAISWGLINLVASYVGRLT